MSAQDITTLVEERVAAITGAPRMDLSAIAAAGIRREQALKVADRALDDIVDVVAEAGGDANIAAAARLAGVSRSAIYARLNARGVA